MPADPAAAQLEAYNARDIDRFVACYSEDVVVEDGLGARISTGRAAFRERYAKMFAAFPDLHCRLVSRIRVGDWVLDEERVTGRNDGESHVVAVYRVEGDVITHVRFLR